MMATSVSLSLVGMTDWFLVPRPGEHRVVVRGLVVSPRGRPETLLVRVHDRADAGIANEIPADEAGVSAVVGIAERPLEGVGANQIEERPVRKSRCGTA